MKWAFNHEILACCAGSPSQAHPPLSNTPWPAASSVSLAATQALGGRRHPALEAAAHWGMNDFEKSGGLAGSVHGGDLADVHGAPDLAMLFPLAAPSLPPAAAPSLLEPGSALLMWANKHQYGSQVSLACRSLISNALG